MLVGVLGHHWPAEKKNALDELVYFTCTTNGPKIGPPDVCYLGHLGTLVYHCAQYMNFWDSNIIVYNSVIIVYDSVIMFLKMSVAWVNYQKCSM